MKYIRFNNNYFLKVEPNKLQLIDHQSTIYYLLFLFASIYLYTIEDINSILCICISTLCLLGCLITPKFVIDIDRDCVYRYYYIFGFKIIKFFEIYNHVNVHFIFHKTVIGGGSALIFPYSFECLDLTTNEKILIGQFSSRNDVLKFRDKVTANTKISLEVIDKL